MTDCIHGMEKSWCSLCLPQDPKPNYGFPAKYPGICAECRWEIDEGDLITGSDDGWVHVECS